MGGSASKGLLLEADISGLDALNGGGDGLTRYATCFSCLVFLAGLDSGLEVSVACLPRLSEECYFSPSHHPSRRMAT